ncbi:hypothetical protein L596_026374 [Steinernema carpocapsae]|uniref:CCHC-type domain-containing protein n=1 Tax=Steinernema carpocapsae TaxID=34508 RepID=A0A4U5M159_STECR|nr:hypothetical protein L596_026374 [Steinernema carpocapsae]
MVWNRCRMRRTSEETKPPVLENLTPTLIAKPVDLSPEALERTESKVTPEDVRQDDLSEHLVEEDSQKDGVESVQAEETVDTAVVNAVLEATSTSTEIENTSEETEPAVLEHLTPTVIDRPVDVSQEALEKAERQNSAKEDSQEDQKTHARDAQESQSPELVKETAEKHVDDSKATEQSERQATPENAQNKEDDHKAAIFQNEKTVDKSEVSTDVNSEPLQVNGQVSLTEEVETEDSVATNHCGREDPKKIDYRVLSDDAVQENVQEPLTEEAETTAVKLRIQKIAESLAEAEEVHESFEADVCKDSRAYRATNISQEPTVSEEAKDLAAEEAREQQIAEDRLLDALKESDSKVTSIKEASSEDFEASSEDELYTKLMEDWVSFVSDEILALVIATCERLLPEVDLSLPVAETGTPKDGDTIQLQNMLTDVTVNVIGVLGYAVTVQDDFVTMLTEEDPVETNDLAETVWPSYLTPYLDVTDVYHEEQQEQEEGLALVNSECSSIASISDDEARSVGKYVRGRGCFGVDPDDLVTVVESDHSSREESEGTLSQADLEDLKEEIQADNEEDDEPVKNASQQLKGTKDHSQSEDEFEVIQEAVAKDSEDVEILKNGAEPPERSEDQSELESKPKKDLEAVAMNSENIDAFKKASENPTATVDEGRSEAKFEEIQKAAIKKPELVEGVKSFKEGSEPPKSIADQSQPEVKLEDTQQSVAEGSAPVKEIDVFKQIPRSLRKSEDKTEPEIEPEENLEVVAGSSDNVKTSENASEAPLATKIHSEPEEPKAEPLSKDTDLSEISQEDQEVKQATTNTNDNDWSSSRKTLEVQVQKPKKEKRRFPTPEPEVVDPEEEDWFDSAPPEDEPAGSYLNPTDSKRAQIAAILATVQQPKTATAKNTYFPQSQGSSTSTSGITLGAEPSGCWKCGLKDHFQRDCPHPRPKCYRCDEFGHKAFECVAVAKMNRLWNRAGLYGGPRKWKGSEDTE